MAFPVLSKCLIDSKHIYVSFTNQVQLSCDESSDPYVINVNFTME